MIPKQIEEQARLAEEYLERLGQEEPGEGAATPEPETHEEPLVPETPVETEEEKSFREKYLTLKGKYDAEVPRLHSELKEFKEKVFERFERQVSQVQEPTQPETPAESERLAKFREEYGDDFVESLRELLKTETEPLFRERLTPIQEQVRNTAEVQADVATRNFTSYLDDQVNGDWQRLWKGEDPAFLDFLQQSDPSGLYTWGDLVQLYNENWDADKLARVLNHYLESKTPPAGFDPKTDDPRLTKPLAPNPAKEALIAPSRAPSPTVPKAEEKRIWTMSSVEAFKKADRQGKYSSEESQLMWNDLLEAMNENRIKP